MVELKNLLWPYDDLVLTKTEHEVSFQTSWLKAKNSNPIDPKTIEYIETIRTQGPKSIQDFKIMDAFFRPMNKFPLCYYLPVQEKPQDKILSEYKTDLKEVAWPIHDVLALSRCQNGMYDPVSVLSCLRLEHLQDLMVHQKSSVRTDILKLNIENLRKTVLLLLRQNHYVTQRCEEVLSAALNCHPEATQRIEDFIFEEKGHDKLLGLSFERLKVKPEDIEVLPCLVTLMDTFKHLAEKNLIAFCFMVDMFERSPAAKDNPMIQGLIKLGEHEAAKPIEAHSNINTQGDHDQESFEILDTIGAVPEAYVLEAVALAKLASDQMLAFLRERESKMSVADYK